MNKATVTIAAITMLGALSAPAMAGSERVSGYTRSDGTYVMPYSRTTPDRSLYNNYSTPGNFNPNTGTTTGGNLNTYIQSHSQPAPQAFTSNTYSAPMYSAPAYSAPISTYGSGGYSAYGTGTTGYSSYGSSPTYGRYTR